jgi:hypothetical protein
VNEAKAAQAINTIALGLGELAEALNESGPVRPESGAAGIAASPAAGHPAAPFEASPFAVESSTPVEYIKTSETMQSQPSLADESVEFAPQGSEAMCPRHKRAFRESKFPNKPDYCTAKEDDPKWSRNGFCSINADNVQKWLREQVAA